MTQRRHDLSLVLSDWSALDRKRNGESNFALVTLKHTQEKARKAHLSTAKKETILLKQRPL